MAKLQLRILTSSVVKVDEQVDMVIMRTIIEDMGKNSAVGDIGILPNHVPLSAVLGISPLRILNEGSERVLAVFGGVMEVRDNVVTVMTETALWPDEIDKDAAKQEYERAESEKASLTEDAEIRRNKIALRRALVQMEVAS